MSKKRARACIYKKKAVYLHAFSIKVYGNYSNSD